MFFWATLIAFVTAALMTRTLSDPGSRFQILDHPNERSLHTRPTPRTGGIAIVIGTVSGVIVWGLLLPAEVPRDAMWVGALAVAIALVAFLDDRWSLPVGYRLIAQLAIAAALVAGGLLIRSVPLPGFDVVMPEWLAAAITVIFVVWMTNLYNFMDGMDGFAGGMAVFGFGAFALFGWLAGYETFTVASAVVAGAAGGFLVFNFPPARIFMGDTGSSTLGFLAAGMALWAENARILPLWASVLVFSPFVADASVTLIRRLLHGENVWRAHKTHYYQRLVQAGWGHRKTVLVEYGIMTVSVGAALLAFRATAVLQWVSIGAMALFYGILFFWVSGMDREAATMAGTGGSGDS